MPTKIPAPAKNFNPESFCRDFVKKVYEDYHLNIREDDPILAEIAMLEMFADQMRTQQEQLLLYSTTNMTALSQKWKDKEKEFFNEYFKQIEQWQKDLQVMVKSSFLDAVRKAFNEMTKKHLKEIDAVFELKKKELKRQNWICTITWLLGSVVIAGASLYIAFNA